MRRLQRRTDNSYDITIGNQEEELKNENFLTDLSRFRRINAPLLVVTLILICFGLIMLFSASMSTSFATQNDNSKYYFLNQTLFTLFGLAVALVIARFFEIDLFNNYRLMILAYLVTTVLLAMVMVRGRSQMGATRWLTIGPVGFQPSEIAKMMIVFVTAVYYAEVRKKRAKGFYRKTDPLKQFLLDGRIDFLYPALGMGVWVILIVIQPHLSGAIIFVTLCFALLCGAQIPWRSWLSGILQLVPILMVGVVLLVLTFPLFMKGETFFGFVEKRFSHSVKRVETFESEDEVSEDQSYQTRQAEITMGVGGLTGVGLGQGRQKYNYLPQIHNDYIFPAIAEELGYLGTMSVLILFGALFLIGVRIALRANSIFASLIAWGYTFLLLLQAVLNIAVAAKVIPATGITLPFFSYGGTSNIIFTVEVGLILCVSRSGQITNPRLLNLMRPPTSRSARLRRANAGRAPGRSSISGRGHG